MLQNVAFRNEYLIVFPRTTTIPRSHL